MTPARFCHRVILLVLLLLGVLQSCRTIMPIPTGTTHSDSTWIEQVVFPIPLPEDSAWAAYFVECMETNDGLQAKITSLEDARAGYFLRPPVAEIRNNVLQVKAKSRDTVFRPVASVLHSKETVTITYEKTTNILKSWDWFWIRWGQILTCLIVLAALFFTIKNKWYSLLIELIISGVNKLRKKKS